MDDYEFSEVKGPRRKKRPRGMAWNVLTILVLMATIGIVLIFVMIYFNPYSNLNPFPPATFNPSFATVTSTVVPRFTLVPSWTPTNVIIQATGTPEPTNTPVAITSLVDDTSSITPTISIAGDDYAFVVQQGSPAAIDGAQFHPNGGCDWSGVAGQATSMNGEAVKGLFVQLGGAIPEAEGMDNLTMTGLAPQYGQGGFEITLSNTLVATRRTLWVQLLDQQNLPLSDRIYFDTFDDCTKNLVIIYFNQVH